MITSFESDLLQLLRKDASQSHETLAKLLGSSQETVTSTIRKLEKQGVILKYTAIIHDEKARTDKSPIRALVELKVNPQKRTGFDAIATRIAKYNQVITHYLVSGSYDFLVIVEGKSLQEVAMFVSNKLATLDPVISTSTHFIMTKYKENGMLLASPKETGQLAVSP